MTKEVLVVPHNHFDPTWRRCYDRPAIYNGVTVRSYAEVEEHVINAFLEVAPRGHTFDDGQASVWRKYLERNPDKLEALRGEVAAGRLNIVLAGEAIQDSVMSTAEGLVRNFLVAMPLYRRLVDADHPGMKMGWLMDAFGNSPNYPQVLRGVGAEIACGTGYRPCPDDIWVGIDGSRIACIDNMITHGGMTWTYFPPCGDCHGEGCDACDDNGMILSGYIMAHHLPAFREAADGDDDAPIVLITTEECLPGPALIDSLDELNKEYAGRCTFRVGTWADAWDRRRERLAAAAAERDDTPTPDLTPGMPGCMVSRIRAKQRARSIAYRLVNAEARLANAAWEAGRPEAPPTPFADAWQKVAFSQFHDAITGTHIDSAHVELMDMLDHAEAIAVDQGAPAAPAAPPAAFAAATGQTESLRIGNFDVEFDLEGIRGIRAAGATNDAPDWFEAREPVDRFRRALRIGELVIEADFGDPWGTRMREGDLIPGSANAIFLGPYQDRVEAADGAIRWHGQYTSGDPSVRRLEWTVAVHASADGRMLQFVTTVDWDTGSRRLRAVFPVNSKDDTATFECPFGFTSRTFDAEKINLDTMTINTQETPTLHWGCKDLGDGRGVALFNKGLPCYRYIRGHFDLSLLRSPQAWLSANIPKQYEFWDIDGHRDTGKHCFEYALLPYDDGLTPGDLTRRGYEYNRPEPIALPFEVSGDIVVTAWKLAEDGHGWILRLHEANGQGTTVVIAFDDEREVTTTNLLEEPQTEPVRTARYETELHKHGILTLRVV